MKEQLANLLLARDRLVNKLGELEYRYNQMACSPSLVRKAMAERIIKKNLEIVENTNQILSLTDAK